MPWLSIGEWAFQCVEFSDLDYARKNGTCLISLGGLDSSNTLQSGLRSSYSTAESGGRQPPPERRQRQRQAAAARVSRPRPGRLRARACAAPRPADKPAPRPIAAAGWQIFVRADEEATVKQLFSPFYAFTWQLWLALVMTAALVGVCLCERRAPPLVG